MADQEENQLNTLEELVEQMRENGRSNGEIERHTRNSRRHLLDSKKELGLQTNSLKDMSTAISNISIEAPESDVNNITVKSPEFIGPPAPEPVVNIIEPSAPTPLEPLQVEVKEDTETKREQNKLQLAMLKGIQGVGSGIKNLAGKFKDNAGFLAGLAGIALAVFNPEKLKELINHTVGAIVDAFDIVTNIFEGDFKGALEIFKENWKDISIGLGLVVALNFGKIVGFISKIKTGLIAIKGAMAAAGIGLGPAVAIGAAVVLVIAAMVKTYEKMKQTFEETGSIFETLKAGLIELPAQLIGIPLDLIKKAVSFIADAFGFDTTIIDEFSFTDTFRTLFTSIFEAFESAITYVKDIVMSVVETAPEMFSKVVDVVKDAFDNMVNKFKSIGTMIKAFGLGAIAAIKAGPGAVFGGEQPMEAFDRVYNEVMSGGNGDSNKVEKMEVEADNRGEELDSVSTANKAATTNAQSAAPVIVTNNVDNSNNSKTSNAVVGSRRKRRGFGTNTDAAYA